MYIGVFSACVSVHCVCAVPVEARRGHQQPLLPTNSNQVVFSFQVGTGNLGPLEEQQCLLSHLSSLQNDLLETLLKA